MADKTKAPPVPSPAAQKPPGQRILLYGMGGVGKTTLACAAPSPVAFFDLDDAIPRLASAKKFDVRIHRANNWNTLLSGIRSLNQCSTIVIDSASIAEELAMKWVLDNIPKSRGAKADYIEDYGYSKGYSYIYDQFVMLFAALDNHANPAGRHIILVCHYTIDTFKNPEGENYPQYVPRLQARGNSSVRHRAIEWADHVLFFNYDVAIQEGKAVGGASRAIYPVQYPWFVAKTRSALRDPYSIKEFDGSVWQHIIS